MEVVLLDVHAGKVHAQVVREIDARELTLVVGTRGFRARVDVTRDDLEFLARRLADFARTPSI